MPTVWLSFRRTINCGGSDPSEVHNPRTVKHLSSILTPSTKKSTAIISWSGCSRSLSNLRDVMAAMHGSKGHVSTNPPPPSYNYSPRSIVSGEFVTHSSSSSLSHDDLVLIAGGGGGGNSDRFYQRRHKTNNNAVVKRGGILELDKKRALRAEVGEGTFNNDGNNGNICLRCGDRFAMFEDLESHHLHKHAVSELTEGDSSRKIVEIICRSSSNYGDNPAVKIAKIFKIHNSRRTLARFEDHRETVKNKANKLPKKHPRCIADGNELLRFHTTNLACNLGAKNEPSFDLCVSDNCGVCRVIRQGFEINDGMIGVFTASTAERALESLLCNDGSSMARKALLVCRVIAGRVHRPTATEIVVRSGFDSLAGKMGVCSNIEELYLFDSCALLPCFLILCKD